MAAREAGQSRIISDAKADVWSLGIVAYELVMGHRVWPRTMRRHEIIEQLLGGAPLPWEDPGEHAGLRLPHEEVLVLGSASPQPGPEVPQRAPLNIGHASPPPEQRLLPYNLHAAQRESNEQVRLNVLDSLQALGHAGAGPAARRGGAWRQRRSLGLGLLRKAIMGCLRRLPEDRMTSQELLMELDRHFSEVTTTTEPVEFGGLNASAMNR
jgi:serine/threonine protein kinase